MTDQVLGDVIFFGPLAVAVGYLIWAWWDDRTPSPNSKRFQRVMVREVDYAITEGKRAMERVSCGETTATWESHRLRTERKPSTSYHGAKLMQSVRK